VSEHFVLRTDLDRDEAGNLVRELETMRRAVLAALFLEAREPPGRVEVVAFRDGREYQAFAPANAAAYYLRAAGGPPRLVMPGRLGDWQRVVLAHELTHHALAGASARQPRWLAEGMAVWMEGLARVPLGPHIVLGNVRESRFPTARTRRVPARELFAWDEAPPDWDWLDYYSSALALVRHLQDQYPEAVRDLVARLAAGQDPDAAFGAAFPQFDPAKPGALEALDAEVLTRLSTGVQFDGRDLHVEVGGAWAELPLEPDEVSALRITLWNLGPPKPRAALEAEVHEVLRHDPAHPVGLQVLSELDGADPVPRARRAVAAHPDDARAWTFLGAVLQGPGASAEREEALRRAADLAPENAAVLWNLARELLARRRSGEALPLARRAARLAPWSPPVLQGYAEVLADLGQCRAALDVQRRAAELCSERSAEAERAALRRRLQEMERGCAPLPPPGADRPGAQGSRTASP
jgi:tetratricopeptide (TPR) repeat protein